MNIQNILIFKPDHIGDYIIFRNFLYEIKNTPLYRDSNIICVLNQKVENIASFLDTTIVYKFIFIDLENYLSKDWYYARKNEEIFFYNYSIVINAMLKKFIPIEKCIFSISSVEKIQLHDSLYQDTNFCEKYYAKNYTKIIDISVREFEFEKFKQAFENILDKKINLNSPTITLPKNKSYLNISYEFDYITVFIGSHDEYRKWGLFNYINLINLIIENTNYHIILCGSSSECFDATEIENKIIDNSKFHNLVSQTSLIDMLYILNNSKCNISNETGNAHMSIALNKYTLVISNGNHFGKFTPYPKSYTNKYYSVYPFEIKNENDFKNAKKLYYSSSTIDINEIKLDKVIATLNKVFHKLNISEIKKDKMYQSFNYKLSPNQINLNYDFSIKLSKIYNQTLKLKQSNKRFVLYGNGSLGIIINSILKDSCMGIIDKKNINSFRYLEHNNYDYIIITVLGRENEIIEDLITKYNINIDKVIKFKINENKYIFKK